MNLTPVLISFRKIELLDNVAPSFQSDVDATYGKEKSISNKSRKRTRLLIKESYVSAEQKENGKAEDLSKKGIVNLTKAKKEIEKFETDFVFLV